MFPVFGSHVFRDIDQSTVGFHAEQELHTRIVPAVQVNRLRERRVAPQHDLAKARAAT